MIKADIKAIAFGMYCKNIMPKDIAKELGLGYSQTIYKWIKKEKWEQKRVDINKVAKEKEVDKTDKFYKSVPKVVINLYAEAINQNRQKMIDSITHRDAISAVKASRLLEGESTENVNITGEISIQKVLEISRKVQKEKAKCKTAKLKQ